MPDTARIVFLDDGLEVFVLEGNAGVSLSSYRRMLPASPALEIDLWPTAPSAELRDKRFATVDELVAAFGPGSDCSLLTAAPPRAGSRRAAIS
jgi:hypothetical protein